jgi:hypothetical protein
MDQSPVYEQSGRIVDGKDHGIQAVLLRAQCPDHSDGSGQVDDKDDTGTGLEKKYVLNEPALKKGLNKVFDHDLLILIGLRPPKKALM